MIPIVDFARDELSLRRRRRHAAARDGRGRDCEGLDVQSREEEMARSLGQKEDGE